MSRSYFDPEAVALAPVIPDNPAVTGSNPIAATCRPHFEIARPWGHMEGRRRETSAFSRSRASTGNELRRWCSHGALGPPLRRDSHRRSHCGHSAPFPPQTLATLIVSRRPGYGGVASAQSVATLSQPAPMRLVFRDCQSTKHSASRHLSNQLPSRRTVGTLIARWQNNGQGWCRSRSVATRAGNRTVAGFD